MGLIIREGSFKHKLFPVSQKLHKIAHPGVIQEPGGGQIVLPVMGLGSAGGRCGSLGLGWALGRAVVQSVSACWCVELSGWKRRHLQRDPLPQLLGLLPSLQGLQDIVELHHAHRGETECPASTSYYVDKVVIVCRGQVDQPIVDVLFGEWENMRLESGLCWNTLPSWPRGPFFFFLFFLNLPKVKDMPAVNSVDKHWTDEFIN